jgi:hypothetical protein
MDYTQYCTVQKKLAVKPLIIQGAKASIQGGIAIMQQSSNTVITELLFDAIIDNEIIPAGARIAFLGTAEATIWNKRVLNHEGVEFVLAPYEDAILISSPKG